MLDIIIVSVLAVVATSLFHFSVLKWLSGGMARIRMSAGPDPSDRIGGNGRAHRRGCALCRGLLDLD
jgi:hypothetical protein